MHWRAIEPLGIGLAADLGSGDAKLWDLQFGANRVDYLNLSAHTTQLARLQYYLGQVRTPLPPVVFHTLNFNIADSAEEHPDLVAGTREIVRYLRPRWLASDMAVWCSEAGVYQDAMMFPAVLDARSAVEVARKAKSLMSAFGLPFFVENAPYCAVAGQQPLPEFMQTVAAEADCGIVLDIGHLLTYCHARGLGLEDAEIALSFLECVAEVHLAGIDEVATHRGVQLLDRHDVPIREDCWVFLEKHLPQMENLKGITLEQESCEPELIEEHVDRLRDVVRRRRPTSWH